MRLVLRRKGVLQEFHILVRDIEEGKPLRLSTKKGRYWRRVRPKGAVFYGLTLWGYMKSSTLFSVWPGQVRRIHLDLCTGVAGQRPLNSSRAEQVNQKCRQVQYSSTEKREIWLPSRARTRKKEADDRSATLRTFTLTWQIHPIERTGTS